MNPRAVAYTITATLASGVVLAVFGEGMFYVCVFVALVVWLAVTIEQRDEARKAAKTARADRKAKLLAINRQLSLLAENLALKAELERVEALYDKADQENAHLFDTLTEHRLTTDPTTRVPRLRVLPSVASDDDWFARLYDERGWVQ